MIYEYDGIMRNIYTDGREHRDDIGLTWMGDSIGYWEDNVLVVETANMNDSTWIDREGVPHSDQMTVIERFELRDDNSLWIDIEINDPVALNEPWISSTAYSELIGLSWSLSVWITLASWSGKIKFQNTTKHKR